MRNIETMIEYIQVGTFLPVIKEVIKIIGKDRLFLVDGEQIIKNPVTEFGLLTDFFGLESNLAFEYNIDKGFHCLEKPVPFCLGKGKGNTKGQVGNSSKENSIYEAYPTITTWKESYTNSVFELFSHIFKCSTKADCCSISVTRWMWLQSYFCSN